MMFPYFGRLFCLAMASFFLIHFCAAVIVRCATSSALRLAERLRPQIAARWLFILRLAPAGLATLVVASVCVPSYLWLEPESAVENVGLACILASFCGIAICALAATRAIRALVRSSRCTAHIALAGIVRPRLIISSEVARALNPQELDAALRHEDAHRISHDNLKRLLLLLAPGILPGVGGFGPLERAWSRFAEWAADDFAVAGSERRSLSLASAIVRVARLGGTREPAPCMTSLVGDCSDLCARVDRLLHGTPPIEKSASGKRVFLGILALSLASTAAIFAPSTLSTVHNLLETLVR
jgi:Zn-dependent protease with chaperone function